MKFESPTSPERKKMNADRALELIDKIKIGVETENLVLRSLLDVHEFIKKSPNISTSEGEDLNLKIGNKLIEFAQSKLDHDGSLIREDGFMIMKEAMTNRFTDISEDVKDKALKIFEEAAQKHGLRTE